MDHNNNNNNNNNQKPQNKDQDQDQDLDKRGNQSFTQDYSQDVSEEKIGYSEFSEEGNGQPVVGQGYNYQEEASQGHQWQNQYEGQYGGQYNGNYQGYAYNQYYQPCYYNPQTQHYQQYHPQHQSYQHQGWHPHPHHPHPPHHRNRPNQKYNWRKHVKDNKNNKRDHHKKRSSSSSSSSSQETHKPTDYSKKKSVRSIEQQFEELSFKDKKSSAKTIRAQQFREELLQYIERYHVAEHVCKKLMNFLLKRYENCEDLAPLKHILAQLEQESLHFFTSDALNLHKIAKQIIKNSFNIRQINAKLDKKLFIKNKRSKKDEQFFLKYPNPLPIKFLEANELLQLDLSHTIFLVDANNIMQKQKIFRHLFDSQEEIAKVQGQVRLQWLLGETLWSEVFYDHRYSPQLYEKVKKQLLNKEAYENCERSASQFADKHLFQNATADDKIVQRLAEIITSPEYKGQNIILISADRQLAQRCAEIAPIMQSSGQYIFKFCKQVMREKYYSRPEMKGIIKRIFSTKYA